MIVSVLITKACVGDFYVGASPSLPSASLLYVALVSNTRIISLRWISIYFLISSRLSAYSLCLLVSFLSALKCCMDSTSTSISFNLFLNLSISARCWDISRFAFDTILVNGDYLRFDLSPPISSSSNSEFSSSSSSSSLLSSSSSSSSSRESSKGYDFYEPVLDSSSIDSWIEGCCCKILSLAGKLSCF